MRIENCMGGERRGKLNPFSYQELNPIITDLPLC